MADDLVSRLKGWGTAVVARHARQHDGPSAGDHILSQHMDLAPGPKQKEKAAGALLGRSGVSRRRRMAAELGGVLRIVPMWACDPAPAKNDAGRPRDNPAVFVDVGLPDETRPIDDAVRHLERQQNGVLRAMIVREEYTTTGTQKMKAARVQARFGGKLTVAQYRNELYKAQEWLRGRVVR